MGIVPSSERRKHNKTEAWVQSLKSVAELVEEFEANRHHRSRQKVVVSEAAFANSRYRDVDCLEKTRVKLRNGSYIHANWVNVDRQRYICTQGPLEKTAETFWSMIWEYDIQVIIMLCNVIEHGQIKCSQYWPSSVSEERFYGDYKVENVSQSLGANGELITTILKVRKGPDSKTLTHLNWRDWPDVDVPENLHLPLQILDTAESLSLKPNSATLSPIVIHCSAGIGRTGALVAVEMALHKIANDGELNMLNIFKELRSQRAQAIQSGLQYVFVIACILNLLLKKGIVQDSEQIHKWFLNYNGYVERKREANEYH
ncbi:hypothetical protein QR680_011720 [Steinernema hermaphroditum]|uniref:Tyrosine-protein phosphatase domain-containing protein n=1 Tax=Steinernema hermaphroditum TaxID=289476 RepID=A0AA39LZ70_9BILA|nr:hypothetical protein QR680_011720 [Steinernema hermaphroditum]